MVINYIIILKPIEYTFVNCLTDIFKYCLTYF